MSRCRLTPLGGHRLSLLALILLCIPGAVAFEPRTTSTPKPRPTPGPGQDGSPAALHLIDRRDSSGPRPPEDSDPVFDWEPHPAIHDHVYPVQNRPRIEDEIDRRVQEKNDQEEQVRAARDPRRFSQSIFQLAGPVQGPEGGVRAAPPPNYIAVEPDPPRKEETIPMMEDQRRKFLGFRRQILFREKVVRKSEPLIGSCFPISLYFLKSSSID